MEKSDINQRLVKHQRLSFTPLQFSFDNWRELIALWWCNCKECNSLNAIAPPGVKGKEEQKAINCQRSFTERKLFMIDEVLYHNAQLHVLQIIYISYLHVHIEVSVFFDCLLVENFSYITVETRDDQLYKWSVQKCDVLKSFYLKTIWWPHLQLIQVAPTSVENPIIFRFLVFSL